MANDSDHGLTEQDVSVYRSLRNVNDSSVTAANLRRAIQDVAGLDFARDERLASLRSEIESADDTAPLSADEFDRLLRKGGRIVLRALQGDLIVPDFQMFKSQVEQIFS